MTPLTGGSFEVDEPERGEANSAEPADTPPEKEHLAPWQQHPFICDRHAFLSVLCFPVIFGQLWQRLTRAQGVCMLVVLLATHVPLVMAFTFATLIVPGVSGRASTDLDGLGHAIYPGVYESAFRTLLPNNVRSHLALN